MKKLITKQKANQMLEEKFLGKYVTFTYPGFQPVSGRCDRIRIGDSGLDSNLVLIFIGDKKYTCSPEALNECLKLINNEDGTTHRGVTDASPGIP